MVVVKAKTPSRLVIECTSDLSNLDELVELTDAFVAGLGIDDELAYKIVLLMSEAATNAITHGNEEDPEKKVEIHVFRDREHIALIVEDEGAGFDPERVENPIAAENLLRDGGRGLFFIREMAEEVYLENSGRRIRMVFRIR
jgi:serine/threonine-protein kinase RsbW